MDSTFIRDPFYNPNSFQYGHNSPYPDPSLFPAQYRVESAPSAASPNQYYNVIQNPSPGYNPVSYTHLTLPTS